MAHAGVSIFADLPELETERLLLRKMRLEDARAVFAYASDPEVTRYVLWRTLRSCNISGLTVRSYQHLDKGKYKVIGLLESKLPTRPYHAEWGSVGEGDRNERYRPFTNIETKIPGMFAVLYIGFAVWNVIEAMY